MRDYEITDNYAIEAMRRGWCLFSPGIPALPAPAPVVSRTDPATQLALAESKNRTRLSEKRRRGSGSTIFAGARGGEALGATPTVQPRATSQLFGG